MCTWPVFAFDKGKQSIRMTLRLLWPREVGPRGQASCGQSILLESSRHIVRCNNFLVQYSVNRVVVRGLLNAKQAWSGESGVPRARAAGGNPLNGWNY